MNDYNKEIFNICREGDKERLKEMIDEGIDINQINKWGNNCLFKVCRSGYKEGIEILIKEGIEIQDRIYKGYIDKDIKRYVKELKIKRELRENYL